jgi:hypothetical protein
VTIAVRGTRAEASTVTGVSATYSVTRADTTQGDVIVVWLIQDVNNKQTFTVTDNAAGGTNVYTQFDGTLDAPPADGGSQTMFLAVAKATESLTITVTYAIPVATNAIWAELVSGSAGLPPAGAAAGQVQIAAGNGADAVTSTNATPDADYAAWLIVGLASCETNLSAPGAGTGFTSGGTGWLFGGGTPSTRSESKRVTSSAAAAATFTATAPGDDFTVHGIILSEASGDSLFFGSGTTS